MSLEFTLVRRAIRLAVIDGPDTGDNPDILQAQGSVLFEPVIKKGDSIQVQTRGGSETYVLAPIECPINDGIISHRGQDGVKLAAGGEGCNPPIIRWKATFSRMQAGGQSFSLAPVIFDAVPGGEIDLTMVAPVAGAPEGVVRGPRGTSLESIIVDGSELVFTAVDDAGSFEIARIPLDDMVRAEADAAAAAAVDGVETVLAATVDAANAARDDAKDHADRAEGAASTATSAAGEASQFRDAAATSETNAAQSKQDAAQSASAAAMSASQAAANATSAAQDASHAEAARTEAVQAQAGAEQAESNAAASEQEATRQADRATSEADRAKTEADRAASEAEASSVKAVAEKVDELLAGAPEAYDTLLEIAEELERSQSAEAALVKEIAGKAPLGHTHTAQDVGAAPASHTHAVGDVTGLQSALDGKANTATVTQRPALFSGTGAPPASIPGAVVGDWWLDTDSKNLYTITGV